MRALIYMLHIRICASTIHKSIECRTSSFKKNVSNNSNNHQNDAVGYRSITVNRSGRRPGRSSEYGHVNNQNHDMSHSNGSPRQLTTTVKERISLPKNAVPVSLMDSSQLVQDTAHNQIIIKGLAHSSLQGNGQGKDNNHRMMMIEKKTELVLELTLPMLHVEPRMYGLKIVHKRTHDHTQNSSRPRTRFRSRSRTRSRRGGQTYTFSLLDMEDDYEEDGKMVTHTSHTHTH